VIHIGNYSSKPNPNTIVVSLSRHINLYFSYTTVVGISVIAPDYRRKLILRKSPSRTTSKHLGMIKKDFIGTDIQEKVPDEVFDAILRILDSRMPLLDEQFGWELMALMGDKDAQRRDGVS
jgi:hypothetical protein